MACSGGTDVIVVASSNCQLVILSQVTNSEIIFAGRSGFSGTETGFRIPKSSFEPILGHGFAAKLKVYTWRTCLFTFFAAGR